ncbi:hypothetical protein BDQ17DRAFT_1424532 [Cyathus striatus]|nr:hypothetical protein BDQ17DRAFT_1424532 [Cyathus striatus]
MCQTGDWNLSYKSLDSVAAHKAIHDLQKMDPDFYKELKATKIDTSITLTDIGSDILEDTEVDVEVLEATFEDDSDLPSGALISEVLGLPQSKTLYRTENSRLYSGAQADEPTVVVLNNEEEEELGPGKWKCKANTCYQSFWHHHDEDGSDIE